REEHPQKLLSNAFPRLSAGISWGVELNASALELKSSNSISQTGSEARSGGVLLDSVFFSWSFLDLSLFFFYLSIFLSFIHLPPSLDLLLSPSRSSHFHFFGSHAGRDHRLIFWSFMVARIDALILLFPHRFGELPAIG
ncbi:MAG: hypothetical protein KF865_10515, partial [Bdellovibrionaceae bacterium]|nr:hypothetical protein [Pseudobdellovibrionaceae bacterium]